MTTSPRHIHHGQGMHFSHEHTDGRHSPIHFHPEMDRAFGSPSMLSTPLPTAQERETRELLLHLRAAMRHTYGIDDLQAAELVATVQKWHEGRRP